MKKSIKKILLLVVLLLVVAVSLAASPYGEREIRVDGSIAAAVEQASPGDILIIPEGVYRESGITLKTNRITLRGEPGAVIDGEGNGHILIIKADSVHIEGLTVRNTGLSHVRDYSAIRLEGAAHFRVNNNRLENNMFGIYVSRSAQGEVTGNRIAGGGARESNSGNGVHIFDSQKVKVSENHISLHRDGIYLEFATSVEITQNVAIDNMRYGLHYMFSRDSVYSGNEFRRNNAGVAVMYSRDVVMNDNIFADNLGPASYGILMKEISGSEVAGNRFENNTIALYSEGSSRVRIENNSFKQNGWAVKIWANSTDNVFSGNAFIDNTFDVATNSRQHYNTFAGNYWSNYDGYDLAGDGIGDVPHRPVRLYSIIVERNPVSLILHRSLFIDVLDLAERVMPALTPETLVDEKPLMKSPLP